MEPTPRPDLEASTTDSARAGRLSECTSAEETGRASRKQRILVVDDEPVIARSLAAILSNHGYEVKYVLSAEDGLSAARVWPPDLAIIDVILPKQNGIQMAIALRVSHPQTKLLLFSGQAEAADLLDLAKESGHEFEILAKPVSPLLVLETISMLLSKAG